MNNKYVDHKMTHKYVCPFRVIDNQTRNCIGPHCMAWKWTAYKSNTNSGYEQSKYEKHWYEKSITKKTNTHGCCGMVYKGKVESHEYVPNV